MYSSVACVITNIFSMLTGQSTSEEANITWYHLVFMKPPSTLKLKVWKSLAYPQLVSGYHILYYETTSHCCRYTTYQTAKYKVVITAGLVELMLESDVKLQSASKMNLCLI